MPIPQDYADELVRGVLGKIIGVYLGRPFRGLDLRRDLVGSRRGLVLRARAAGRAADRHGRRHLGHVPFARAADYGNNSRPDPGPDRPDLAELPDRAADGAVVGWLGNSTEHTAYMRLKHGIPAPRSGSMALLNGKVVAEQIGRARSSSMAGRWSLPGEPGAGGRPARRARQRQPRWRGHLRRAGSRGDGSAGVRREPDLSRLFDAAVG